MSASALAEGRVAGRYFDGQSSQARAAEARVEAGQLEVHLDGGERLQFAADQVRLGTQVGSAGCYLHLGRAQRWSRPMLPVCRRWCGRCARQPPERCGCIAWRSARA
ncbi:hypothetical protein ULF88_15950 [Halopseudomonas pachastrellae]|nr:hypothetical protein [Halopseudomonas pachastrellae]